MSVRPVFLRRPSLLLLFQRLLPVDFHLDQGRRLPRHLFALWVKLPYEMPAPCVPLELRLVHVLLDRLRVVHEELVVERVFLDRFRELRLRVLEALQLLLVVEGCSSPRPTKSR